MRVLITGFNRKQCGIRTKQNYKNVFDCYYDAISQRHDVVQRPVTPGEDLSHYDVAIVGVHAPDSLGSMPHKYGAMWAAHQLPHLVGFHDWRVKTAGEGYFESKVWNYALACQNKKYEQIFETAARYSRQIEEVREQWCNRDFGTVLLPMYNWADETGFPHPAQRVLKWDPSAMFPTWWDEARGPRERRWVLATLSDQRQWVEDQGLTWDVKAWQKPKDSGWGVHVDFIAESELVPDWYCTSWGILMPYYGGKEMPVGWWRSRPVQSAAARSVLLADPRELGDIGEPFTYSARHIEELSDRGLRDLAEAQSNHFFMNVYRKSEAIDQLCVHLESVV